MSASDDMTLNSAVAISNNINTPDPHSGMPGASASLHGGRRSEETPSDGEPVTPDAAQRPYRPEVMCLRQGWHTQWIVSYEAGIEPDNWGAGWIDLYADADSRKVEFDGYELSPVEARNFAQALIEAAAHAEQYPTTVSSVLLDEQLTGYLDQEDLPLEQVRAINTWINNRVARTYRRGAMT